MLQTVIESRSYTLRCFENADSSSSVFKFLADVKMSRDSVVGKRLATAWTPRGRNLSPSTVKNVLTSALSRPALGSTQPPVQWGTGDLSLGVKRQVR
jgi:hypothetical protein